MNNLKNVTLALHNYHQDFGCFPPAYTVDADGKPLHSWRTLILPYLDQTTLYERMRLDEAWDSPHNRALTEQIEGIAIFACPSDESRSTQPNQTNYLAVVGSQTMWPGIEPRTREEVTDGTSQTIMLVEVANSGIDWFEPRDLSFVELSFTLNDPDGPSPSGTHPSVSPWPWPSEKPPVNVTFVDGSGRSLAESTPPQTLRALLTINGDEAVQGF